MTKEEFTRRCFTEFYVLPVIARAWCNWADDLHECDSARLDPKTGQVDEGEEPVKTAEDFLDEFMERMEVMAFAYGTEIAAETLGSGCYFPWEMMQAARYLHNGGDPSKAQEISNENGEFEETVEDEEEYKRLKWEMERSRGTQQGGQMLT